MMPRATFLTRADRLAIREAQLRFREERRNALRLAIAEARRPTAKPADTFASKYRRGILDDVARVNRPRLADYVAKAPTLLSEMVDRVEGREVVNLIATSHRREVTAIRVRGERN